MHSLEHAHGVFLRQSVGAIAVLISTGLSASVALAQFPEEIRWQNLDGVNGFMVSGYLRDEFGFTTAAVGDVNADGIDDVMTGGPGELSAEPPAGEKTPGATYIIFGDSNAAWPAQWSAELLDGTNGFRIPGLFIYDGAGVSASAGDFDNDGIADPLMCASLASPGGLPYSGQCYVLYGRPDLGSGGEFDLLSLDGTNGFSINGITSFDHLGGGLGGGAAGSIGDFDADGIQDILLGAPGGDPAGLHNAGECYILYGGTGIGETGVFDLVGLQNAQAGIMLTGAAAEDEAGAITDSAGDFNGDGFPDIVIGAPTNSQAPKGSLGHVYVVYGGPRWSRSESFSLGSLDGTNGFTIEGGPTDHVGGQTMGLGDVNHDGFEDIGVFVRNPLIFSDRRVVVVFGGANVAPDGTFDLLSGLDGTNGFDVIDSQPGNGDYVTAPASAGDLNHDGIDDFVVGDAGTFVIFGRKGLGTSGCLDVQDIDGRNGFFFKGAGNLYDHGRAGDINDDGIDDLLVGTGHGPGAPNFNVGAMLIVFGRRMGDADLDADVDFADFGALQACFSLRVDDDVPDQCHPFDFDRDNDVDLTDYEAFQDAVGTPP